MSPTYSTKSDVFAFAVILWELSHWTNCYEGVKIGEIRDSIKNGERLEILGNVPKNITNLIRRSWDQNPRQRPSFVDITTFLESICDANGFLKTSLMDLSLVRIGSENMISQEVIKEIPKDDTIPEKGKSNVARAMTYWRQTKYFNYCLLVVSVVLVVLAGTGVLKGTPS